MKLQEQILENMRKVLEQNMEPTHVLVNRGFGAHYVFGLECVIGEPVGAVVHIPTPYKSRPMPAQAETDAQRAYRQVRGRLLGLEQAQILTDERNEVRAMMRLLVDLYDRVGKL